MYEVIEHRKATILLEHYRACFKTLFGKAPHIEDLNNAMSIMKWTIKEFGEQTGRELITTYFSMEDDWLKSRAFPIEFFKKQINRVIASAGVNSKIQLPLYVLGFVENTGQPVLSTRVSDASNAGHNNFKPVLFDQWRAASLEEKLQLKSVRWSESQVLSFEQNWREWGFLN
jgi:hypothetical protein